MIKRIQQYLLTHHPLVWNTRIVWMFPILLLIHLIFFVCGYCNVTLEKLGSLRHGIRLFQGIELFFVVALGALGVIIVWLIFYFRNNAIKQFYNISRWHSAKEFLIIVFIVAGTFTFASSFRLGQLRKTRSLTSEQLFVEEVNTYNLGSTFLPIYKAPYFKLTRCNAPAGTTHYYEDGSGYDTASNDPSIRAIAFALKDPDAFSYRNYCQDATSLSSYPGFWSDSQRSVIIQRWLRNNERDSVKHAIKRALAILNRYKIPFRIDVERMTSWVFADSLNTLQGTITTYDDYLDTSKKNDFIPFYQLEMTFNRLDQCYRNEYRNSEGWEKILFEALCALYASLLIFVYRRFPRRVFIQAKLGVIILIILFASFIESISNGQTASYIYLSIFGLVTLFSFVFLAKKSAKQISAVLLCWHIYLLPGALIILSSLIGRIHFEKMETFYDGGVLTVESLNQEKHPISYWFLTHENLVNGLIILIVILYVVCFYTKLTRKWHLLPEE